MCCETQYIISITKNVLSCLNVMDVGCLLWKRLYNLLQNSIPTSGYVDEVPDAVIENNELYYTFIAVVQTDLTNLREYFNQHIIDEVSRPFSHCCHVEKS